jgi:hypothetical protein
MNIKIRYYLVFFISLFSGLGCIETQEVGPSHHDVASKKSIDEHIDQLSSPQDLDKLIKQALKEHASSYKPEAQQYLKRFFLASEDIAKGKNGSVLLKNYDYPFHLTIEAKATVPTDNVVIILDGGFSDVALTYAKDIVASFEMSSTGELIKKSLELSLPRWAWYLYELQAEAGVPLRIIREARKLGLTFFYPSNNLVNHTDYVKQLKRYNEKGLNSTIVYDGQKAISEDGYHGAILAYTLKEWAPSAKLILVRYDMANVNQDNEFRMLQSLNKIAKDYGASFLVRSSFGQHHWHGFDSKRESLSFLQEKILILNAAPDTDDLARRHAFMQNKAKAPNFIFANIFSTASSGLKINEKGMTFSSLKPYLSTAHPSDIAKFSFFGSKLTEPMRQMSTVFLNRHICFHEYNIVSPEDCPSAMPLPFFPIGFTLDSKVAHETGSVLPSYLRGDTSSAAPWVAAWAIFIKKQLLQEKKTASAEQIKNIIAGYGDGEPRSFQDPIRWGKFTIFYEGYGNGLIVPKKFSDY